MNFKVILICCVLMLYYHVIFALPANADGLDRKDSYYMYKPYTPGVGETVRHCIMQPEIMRCFKKQMIQRLDEAINDNGTWQLNDYIMVEKDRGWTNQRSGEDYLNLTDLLVNKVRDLAESRTIRLRMSPLVQAEARKKGKGGGGDKGGDKGYAMMGGIAMMGMMAQMFMGKVMMLAGGAFILAKMALLFSVLKKSGGGGGGGDGGGGSHVVYADSGGHSSGWQRSVPRHVSHDHHSYSDDHYGHEEST